LDERGHLRLDPAPRQQLLTTTFDAYRDQLTLWSGDGEIVPGVRYVSALGHTPGHQAIMVESNGERFLHMVDAIHTPMQVILPDVVPRFDSRPEVAVQTRQDLIARVLSEHLRIMTYHFAFPGIGTITQGAHSPIFKPEV
jgi:glyoxylase-like metal-dependent hydrolase (beta-lactamase superfamily II)